MVHPEFDRSWLRLPSVQRVFDVLEQAGQEARVVGGAVRNSLLGEPVDDIDIATTATPQMVMAQAAEHSVKAVGTGVEHGTVTLVIEGRPFEVTTLREDVETFGRKATVRFGRDWSHDAQRRDFTLNALYLDRYGQLHDPLGGLDDCLARRVTFIGNAETRIREDYLRILRFYRFHAHYGAGAPDAEGRSACAKLKDGLEQLSAERISKEILKLLSGAGAVACLTMMEEDGILQALFGRRLRVAELECASRLLEGTSFPCDPELGLIVLAIDKPGEAGRLAERLRLSNAFEKRARLAVEASDVLRQAENANAFAHGVKLSLYRYGRQASADGLILAKISGDTSIFAGMLKLVKETQVPVMPLSGRDLLAEGLAAGPEVGRRLKTLEAEWIKSDFLTEKAKLLNIK
ncbi:CCA tRNA nucleotidyltransferase [Roseibium sp.]|uniref:CCA tRNA nucleotidyltransferase n=1 Tax=Roseibium sp. TaxID=1936156 RepID=UPI003A96DF04